MDELDGWTNDAAREQQLAHAPSFLMPCPHTTHPQPQGHSPAHPHSMLPCAPQQQPPADIPNATCNNDCQQQHYSAQWGRKHIAATGNGQQPGSCSNPAAKDTHTHTGLSKTPHNPDSYHTPSHDRQPASVSPSGRLPAVTVRPPTPANTVLSDHGYCCRTLCARCCCHSPCAHSCQAPAAACRPACRLPVHCAALQGRTQHTPP